MEHAGDEPRTLFLVDGSSYIFRAFHALPHLSTSRGLPTNAVYGVTTMLLKLLRQARPEFIAVVFDTLGPTFRHDTYPDYKSHRPQLPEELGAQFPYLYRAVEALRIAALRQPGYEADDVIATVAARMEARGVRTVVVTGDKDLMQTVSAMVTLWDTMRDRRVGLKEVRERFGVEPAQVADVLGLAGDPTDNIPGVKGIGEKTATLLVKRFGSLEKVLSHAGELDRLGVRGGVKLKETLLAEADKARLSKELATARTDVPVEFDLDAARYHGPDRERLRELCQELEFSALLRDLASIPEQIPE